MQLWWARQLQWWCDDNGKKSPYYCNNRDCDHKDLYFPKHKKLYHHSKPNTNFSISILQCVTNNNRLTTLLKTKELSKIKDNSNSELYIIIWKLIKCSFFFFIKATFLIRSLITCIYSKQTPKHNRILQKVG